MFTNIVNWQTFLQVIYIIVFGVDYLDMDLESDKVGLKLKIHVQKSFEDNQHTMPSLLNNFGIGELNPWLRMFCWHKLSINQPHVLARYTHKPNNNNICVHYVHQLWFWLQLIVIDDSNISRTNLYKKDVTRSWFFFLDW